MENRLQWQEDILDWFFNGLGTLLIGLVVGGGAGGAAGWRMGVKSTRQSQRAGRNSKQVQIGRDRITGRED